MIAGPRGLVLVGYRATGKSTVGRILADRLGRPFADADREIEAREGRTVREIFEEGGEVAFRRLESQVVRDLASRLDGGVLATGGGAVLDERNRWVAPDVRLRRLAQGRPRHPGLAAGEFPGRPRSPARPDRGRDSRRDRRRHGRPAAALSRGRRRRGRDLGADDARGGPVGARSVVGGGGALNYLWQIHLIYGIGLFVMGSVVGSFLNVCIYRIPWEKSVIWPDSRCPNCLAAIEHRDNVPVLGWVLLRGACRNCSVPISARYPMIELLVGLLFLAVYLVDGFFPAQYVRDDATLMAKVVYHLILVALLVAITFIDADLTIVPASITNTGIALGLGLGAAFPGDPARSGLRRPPTSAASGSGSSA